MKIDLEFERYMIKDMIMFLDYQFLNVYLFNELLKYDLDSIIFIILIINYRVFFYLRIF